jgi:Leucine-rich repeat (LRR) protein
MNDVEHGAMGAMGAMVVSMLFPEQSERCHKKALTAPRQEDDAVNAAQHVALGKGGHPDALVGEVSPEEATPNSDVEAARPPQDADPDEDAARILPGAYRMYPTNSRGESLDADALQQTTAPTVLVQQSSTDSTTLTDTGGGAPHLPCIEATAVSESPLVVAKPFRRTVWVMAMVIMAVGVMVTIAVAVGVSLVKSNRNSSNQVSATAATNSTNVTGLGSAEIAVNTSDAYFRSTLPNSTLLALQDPNSPQLLAFQWVTSKDRPTFEPASHLHRMTQRFALAMVGLAITPGNSTTPLARWMRQDLNECEWHGCYCATDDPDTIRGISLVGEKLKGSLPREIGLLTRLLSLDLQSNEISGTMPSEIGQLSNLELLLMTGNQLSGGMPRNWGQMTRLRELVVTSNNLEGTIPTELADLSSLSRLNLDSNPFSGRIPTQFGKLTKLEELILGISGSLHGPLPAEFNQLERLETLIIFGFNISSSIPTQLTQLASLKSLALEKCSLEGTIPSELGNLSALTS